VSNTIYVNGLALPYTENSPATSRASGTGLTDPGETLVTPTLFMYKPLGKNEANAILTPKPPYPVAYVPLTTGGFLQGEAENPSPAAGGDGFDPGTAFAANASEVPEIVNGAPGFVMGNYGYLTGDSVEGTSNRLTLADVATIISQGVTEANSIRAAIRDPSGVPVKVHVTVTDIDGNIIGAFRMFDATRFSYDVAIQKARTAAYFSDDAHAFSARSIGFLCDQYFPPAITNGITGPLFHLQEDLSLFFNQAEFLPTLNASITTGTSNHNPLGNGITIFPGGAPLYKNGMLVGGVGVSGDGVDQDDLIASAASAGYMAPTAIRCDALSQTQIISFLEAKIFALQNAGFTFLPLNEETQLLNVHDADELNLDGIPIQPTDTIVTRIKERFAAQGLQGVRLPYQKFPRNPGL